MSQKKQALPIVTSPKGKLRYAFLNTPDTKFDVEGVYKTDLIVDASSAQALMTKIEAAVDERFEQEKDKLPPPKRAKLGKKLPFEEMYNDEGEPTGDIKFHAKVKATGQNDKGETWSNKPPVFDTLKKPVPEGTKIGSGTIAKVAFQIVPYYMASSNEVGVTLRLKAVQVIELSSGGGRNADAYGFGEEEGDFSAEDFSEEQEGTEGGETDPADDF